MTKDLENAVNAVKSALVSSNTTFALTLENWRFGMIEDVHMYFVRRKDFPIFHMYDFLTARNSHEILSALINELKLTNNPKIDMSDTNGQPYQGRYLICYYPTKTELVGSMAVVH